jgi:hypothetical protein
LAGVDEIRVRRIGEAGTVCLDETGPVDRDLGRAGRSAERGNQAPLSDAPHAVAGNDSRLGIVVPDVRQSRGTGLSRRVGWHRDRVSGDRQGLLVLDDSVGREDE